MAGKNIIIRGAVFALGMTALFFVTACSALKTSPEPDRMWAPPKWEKTTKMPDKVWSSIRSEEINGGEPLTLVGLVDIALQRNPSTREAWEKARAAQMRIKEAEGKWYPQVTASMSSTYNYLHADQLFRDLNQADDSVEGDATFLVLDLGGRAASVKEAKQTMIAANFQFNQTFQDLLLDTETAYYNLYSAKSEVEAAEKNVEDAHMSLAAAEQKLKTGLAIKLDVLQARAKYDDALYFLEGARGAVKAAEADLAKTIGVPADAGLEISDPFGEIPINITVEDIGGLIEEALKKRPDISAMRAGLRAKEAAVVVASSDMWPTLNIGGSLFADDYKYYGSEKDDETNPGWDRGYSGYVSVDWNVFDGFSNYAKVKEAKALERAERERLVQAELAASADVWTKYYNYRTAVQKLGFSRALYDTSTEAYDLALESYDNGLKSILDLLQAQTDLAQARSKLIGSRRDVFVTLAELAHSTGSMNVREEDNAAAVTR